MKITKSQLRQIIKEEVDKAINEAEYNVRYDKDSKKFFDTKTGKELTVSQVKLRQSDYEQEEMGGEKQGTGPGLKPTKVKSGTGTGKDNKFRVR
jgi:hypothetical protein|tara:strand:+ start:245 stop:526 length:282 start_codon:yes stop_codon:yes gene_type:complete